MSLDSENEVSDEDTYSKISYCDQGSSRMIFSAVDLSKNAFDRSSENSSRNNLFTLFFDRMEANIMDKNIKKNRTNGSFDKEFSAADNINAYTGKNSIRFHDEEVEKVFGRTDKNRSLLETEVSIHSDMLDEAFNRIRDIEDELETDDEAINEIYDNMFDICSYQTKMKKAIAGLIGVQAVLTIILFCVHHKMVPGSRKVK